MTREIIVVLAGELVDRRSARSTASEQPPALREAHARLSRLLEHAEATEVSVRSTDFFACFPVEDLLVTLSLAVQVQEAMLNDVSQTVGLSLGVSVGPADCILAADGQRHWTGGPLVESTSLAQHGASSAILTELRVQDFLARETRPLVGTHGQLLVFSKRRTVRDAQHQTLIGAHELLWQNQEFGLRSGKRSQRLRGRVQRWVGESQHGFILSDDGEFFYTDQRYLVADIPPTADQTV